MKKLLLISLCIVSGMANAQSWRGCIPDSIGPDGCGTAGSSADQTIGPEDGPAIGPWGNLLVGPGYYGESSGSSGDQPPVDPGDGQALYPDNTRGFNPDMPNPYEPGINQP
jgi:hypothetical protein